MDSALTAIQGAASRRDTNVRGVPIPMQHTDESVETSALEVPALARYARVVRMTAANLASIAGLNVDEVDDVRMAAEEAFIYACATGVQGNMHIEFSMSPDGLAMEFELGDAAVTEDDREPALVYSAFILEAMCDECVIGDAPENRMRLFKRIGGDDVR